MQKNFERIYFCLDREGFILGLIHNMKVSIKLLLIVAVAAVAMLLPSA